MRTDFLAPGSLHRGNDQEPTIAFFFSSGPVPASFIPAVKTLFSTSSPNLMKSDQSRETPPCLHTLKVQVLGSCGSLRGDLGVYLDHVEVVSVAGDDDVVPVVVVEGLVGVAFDQVGPISQVGHVVKVAGRGESLT